MKELPFKQNFDLPPIEDALRIRFKQFENCCFCVIGAPVAAAFNRKVIDVLIRIVVAIANIHVAILGLQ